MKKIIISLYVCLFFIGYQLSAQDCNVPFAVIDEDFNSQPDPNNRTILQDCWGIYYTFTDRGREIGSIQANGTAIAMNSTYGAELISPLVQNTQGTLSFKATGPSGKVLEVGVYSGGFNLLASATMGSNSDNIYTFDLSGVGSASSSSFYFRFGPGTGSLINFTLDDVNYVSKCDNPGNPTAIAQDVTLTFPPGASSVTLDPALLDNGSVDDCGLAVSSFSVDKTEFTCADLGVNTVSFTVTDDRGATDNVLANVTVQPYLGFTKSNYTPVYLDANGELDFTQEELIDDQTTSCAGLTFGIDKLSFTCADISATQSLTLSATYQGNLINTKTLKLFVRDTIAPKNLTVNNLTLTLDEFTGQVSTTPEDVFDAATDNCSSNFTLALSQTDFACEDAGSNTVLLTVTDENGNSATAEATVTILSTISDQTITTPSTSFCPNGSAASATIDMASSEVNVNYYLRNNETNAIVDGPIAGTGNALSFSTGSLSESTTYYVYAESSPPPVTDFALDFDGSDDRVKTSYTQTATSTLTIEGWIYPRSTSRSLIFSNYDGTGLAGGDMFFDTQNTFPYNGKGLRMNIVGSNDDRLILMVDDVLTLNVWNHIAFVFDNGTAKVYSDGVEVGSATASFTSIPAAANPFDFGEHNSATGSIYFDGQLDEFRIWNTARTATELLDNKDIELLGTEPGLAAYYRFNDGAGATLTDAISGANGTLTNMDAATDWVVNRNFVESNICNVRLSTEITIGDSEAPTVVTKNIEVTLDNTGNVTVSASDLDNGSSDGCSLASSLVFSLDQASFDCTMLGANTVNLTVTDEAGNESVGTATITVRDATAPVISDISPITRSLDSNGEFSLDLLVESMLTATDNCTPVEDLLFDLDKENFDCQHIGENTIELSATDLAGNVALKTFTLILTDAAPVVATKDITVELDANGSVTILPSDVEDGSTDDCSEVADLTYDLSISTFGCENLATNQVVLTVTDENGNSGTGLAQVTVVDLLAPTVVTKNIVVHLGENGAASITPDQVDNGSTDNCTTGSGLVKSLDVTSFDTNDIGENTVTLTVQDASGNLSTETAVVTVSNKEIQSVTFDGIANKTFGDPNFDINLSSINTQSETIGFNMF